GAGGGAGWKREAGWSATCGRALRMSATAGAGDGDDGVGAGAWAPAAGTRISITRTRYTICGRAGWTMRDSFPRAAAAVIDSVRPREGSEAKRVSPSSPRVAVREAPARLAGEHVLLTQRSGSRARAAGRRGRAAPAAPPACRVGTGRPSGAGQRR